MKKKLIPIILVIVLAGVLAFLGVQNANQKAQESYARGVAFMDQQNYAGAEAEFLTCAKIDGAKTFLQVREHLSRQQHAEAVAMIGTEPDEAHQKRLALYIRHDIHNRTYDTPEACRAAYEQADALAAYLGADERTTAFLTALDLLDQGDHEQLLSLIQEQPDESVRLALTKFLVAEIETIQPQTMDEDLEKHWMLCRIQQETQPEGDLLEKIRALTLGSGLYEAGTGSGIAPAHEYRYNEGMSKNRIAIPSVEEVALACAQNPSGKVLVAVSGIQIDSRDSQHEYVYISTELMYCLPLDRFPRSLAEVEYILEVGYDFVKDGSYAQQGTSSTQYSKPAVQEFGAVSLFNMKTGEVLYLSDCVYGAQPPQQVDYSKSMILDINPDDAFLTGGAPDLSELILEAIQAIP